MSSQYQKIPQYIDRDNSTVFLSTAFLGITILNVDAEGW
jgi:hypothetical protein